MIGSLNDKNEMLDVMKKILDRFSKLPNTEHMEIWLQRMALDFDNAIVYQSNLCNLVVGEEVEIWNNDWIKRTRQMKPKRQMMLMRLNAIIAPTKMLNQEKRDSIDSRISSDEVNLFLQHY